MQVQDAVGLTLISGLLAFLIGAGAWRLRYEQPMPQVLQVIHDDRRRRAWIHLWMVPAMFVTTAGVGGYAVMTGAGSTAAAFAVMASMVYAMGAVCWVVSLAFRLTVVPWAAEHAVNHGNPPAGFVALDRWAGALYVMHMASAYAAFALLGAAALLGHDLPPWGRMARRRLGTVLPGRIRRDPLRRTVQSSVLGARLHRRRWRHPPRVVTRRPTRHPDAPSRSNLNVEAQLR
jgi:hypothetical protein